MTDLAQGKKKNGCHARGAAHLQPEKKFALELKRRRVNAVGLINDKQSSYNRELNRNVIEFEINDENLRQVWGKRSVAAAPRCYGFCVKIYNR